MTLAYLLISRRIPATFGGQKVTVTKLKNNKLFKLYETDPKETRATAAGK